MIANSIPIVGFVCEADENSTKIYDCTSSELLKFPYSNYPLTVGEWISPEKISKIEVFLEENEVFVKTIAMKPNPMSLPLNLKQKFKKGAWSPILKEISDPNDVIGDNFDVPLLVTAKYSPSEFTIFDVVSVEPCEIAVSERNSMFSNAPWAGKIAHHNTFDKPDYAPMAKSLPPRHRSQSTYTGICIATNWPNTFYNPKKTGSAQEISLFFAPNLGLTRGINREDNPSEVGKWYTYELNRKKQSKLLIDARVTKKVLCEPPIATWQVGGSFEMKTHFSISLEYLKKPENRKRAHFKDPVLGRVEIYPEHIDFIVQKIDNANEPALIKIGAKVELTDKWKKVPKRDELLWNWRSLERNQSIFWVSQILEIHVAEQAIFCAI